VWQARVLAYDTNIQIVNYLLSSRLAALALPIMAPNPTSDLSSVFKTGELKPGIYKIQNIYTEAFLDIHVHTLEGSVLSSPQRSWGGKGTRKSVSKGPPKLSQQSPETLGSGSLPPYDEDATVEQSSTRVQHAESERDSLGTIVTEVAIVTTRKRYRVEEN